MFSHLCLVLALSVAAATSSVVVRDSLITLPLVKHLNYTGTPLKLAEIDRARVKALTTSPKLTASQIQDSTTYPADITNTAVSYVAQVQIGNPPDPYTLIVDTGSSNTWIGARSPGIVPGGATLQGVVSVTYGSGAFLGTEYGVNFTIGNMNLPSQSIGVALLSYGSSGVDGILGQVHHIYVELSFKKLISISIGPTDLTIGTLLLSPNQEIPTVTDNAFTSGLISSKMVGIYFQPTTSTSDANGELTFGGVDDTKYVGDLNYVSADHINLSLKLLRRHQSDNHLRYQMATGGVIDSTTGLLKISLTQYENLNSLFFNIGGITYELTSNAQIWPRALNNVIGGSSDGIYLIVSSTGKTSGSGMDFINGMTFLERFYTAYDSGNNRCGIAETAYTYATSN
ncbi:hypothetical protein EW026_g8411 [Hermanssonia centrifuga]|uniref:Peptidase A1 domain-containing protein n=1 Tax=Hermanssonia centrifuga TaxID=98765 RepID=A0A4S4K8I8_9APHY|nr:hypothetical protein EW026_g8411 [Hermanssonia centrifuga]